MNRIPTALLALALALPSMALADDGPRKFEFLPDEGGGLWSVAREPEGRVFLRFCEPGLPQHCSPWAAADLGWDERLTEPQEIEVWSGIDLGDRLD